MVCRRRRPHLAASSAASSAASRKRWTPAAPTRSPTFPCGPRSSSAVGAIPFVLAVVRRPRVGANHFALTVRPGWVRTLVLPWSRVAEVTTADIAGERYLLVRLPGRPRPHGRPTRLGWIRPSSARCPRGLPEGQAASTSPCGCATSPAARRRPDERAGRLRPGPRLDRQPLNPVLLHMPSSGRRARDRCSRQTPLRCAPAARFALPKPAAGREGTDSAECVDPGVSAVDTSSRMVAAARGNASTRIWVSRSGSRARTGLSV